MHLNIILWVSHFSYGSLTDTERNKGGLSKIQIATAVVTSFVSCFIVGAVISMSLMLWVRSVKRSKLRGRKITRLSKGHLSMKYSEVSLLSPGVVKAHLFEFPRSNLELQDIIGKFLSLCQCSYTMVSPGECMWVHLHPIHAPVHPSYAWHFVVLLSLSHAQYTTLW